MSIRYWISSRHALNLNVRKHCYLATTGSGTGRIADAGWVTLTGLTVRKVAETGGAAVAFETAETMAADALARNGFTQCGSWGTVLGAVGHRSFGVAAAWDARWRQRRSLWPVVTIQALLAVDTHGKTLNFKWWKLLKYFGLVNDMYRAVDTDAAALVDVMNVQTATVACNESVVLTFLCMTVTLTLLA